MFLPRTKPWNGFSGDVAEIVRFAYVVSTLVGVLKIWALIARVVAKCASETLLEIRLVGQTLVLGAATFGFDRTGSRTLLHLAVKIRLFLRLTGKSPWPKSEWMTVWTFSLFLRNPLTLKLATMAYPVQMKIGRFTVALDPLLAALERRSKSDKRRAKLVPGWFGVIAVQQD
jgi:hypothetical protein